MKYLTDLNHECLIKFYNAYVWKSEETTSLALKYEFYSMNLNGILKTKKTFTDLEILHLLINLLDVLDYLINVKKC